MKYLIRYQLKYLLKDLLMAILLVAITITSVFAFCNINNSDDGQELVSVCHIVSKGESVGSIAKLYYPPDYPPSKFGEFVYKIINVYNKDLFNKRQQQGIPRGTICPGDHLIIKFRAHVTKD